MSRKSEHSNTKAAAKKYLEWLQGLGCFDEIYLQGSRSPLRDKKTHSDSDWDFGLVTKAENLRIVHPRTSGQLHADICIVNSRDMLHTKAVMVYPKDEHGVFK
jgi:hypothetical protein